MKESSLENPDDVMATGKFQKVRFVCITLAAPGLKRGIVIPVFTSSQMLGVLKLVEKIGNDFSLTRKLSRFLLWKYSDFHSLEQGKIPSDNLYADWLREFCAKEGMLTGSFAAIGDA